MKENIDKNAAGIVKDFEESIKSSKVLNFMNNSKLINGKCFWIFITVEKQWKISKKLCY